MGALRLRSWPAVVFSAFLFLCDALPISAAQANEDPGPSLPGTESPPTKQSAPSDRMPPEQEPGIASLTRRSQDITLSDGTLMRLPQSRFHLDQALHAPDWLYLGLDFRTRYESYDQPIRKGETTGA